MKETRKNMGESSLSDVRSRRFVFWVSRSAFGAQISDVGTRMTDIRNIKILMIFAMIIFLFSMVSAQVIGGEVVSTSFVSPSWQKVFVYDVNDVNSYIEAYVSPQDNRYSFMNSYVSGGKIFSEDSLIRAEILDFDNGFFGGPVDMNLSFDNSKYYQCDDCDIFSKIEFREVVKFYEPNRMLYVSDDGSFDINVNVYDDCDLFVKKNDTYDMLCERGCDYDDIMYGNYGTNHVNFMTDCHTGKRFKGTSRDLFVTDDSKYVNFDKEMLLVSDDEYKISFFGTKSEGDFSITDFMPNEFEIYNVSDSGHVYLEDGYYAIKWDTGYEISEGGSFNFTYYVRPIARLKNCDYGVEDLFWDVGGTFNITNKRFYFDCNFSDDISLFLAKSVDIDRDMGKKIKNKEGISVLLNGKIKCDETKSDIGCLMSDFEFKEYVPIEFQISSISNGGILSFSSSEYNVITWNVSGQDFDVSYNVMPSSSGDYSFVSELGGYKVEEYNVSVYDFIPPVGKSKGGGGSGGYVYKPKNISVADPFHPYIAKHDNLTAALYPDDFNPALAFEIFGFEPSKIYNRSMKLVSAYSFETNDGEGVSKMSFEYRANKNDKYKNLEFYGTDVSGKKNRITGMSVYEDGDDIIYRFDSEEYFRNIVVYGIKDKLNIIDRFLNWWYLLTRRSTK